MFSVKVLYLYSLELNKSLNDKLTVALSLRKSLFIVKSADIDDLTSE